MKPHPIINKCLGLNNTVDPLQVQEAEELLVTDLAVAVDVVVTDTNKLTLPDGYLVLEDLVDGHSLFCDGGDCLVNDGTTMYQVLYDLHLVPVLTWMSGDRLSHVQYEGSIYYSNTRENGIFYEGSCHSWDVEAYNGPDTSRFFERSVPYFSHIEKYNGHMLGAIDNALYVSVIGMFGLWEMIPVFVCETRIVMVKAVRDGVFVSDEKLTYFLHGETPEEFKEFVALTFPAFEWSAAIDYVNAADIGIDAGGLCALWNSKKGLCLGAADGSAFNLVNRKISLPAGGSTGASLLRKCNAISTLR